MEPPMIGAWQVEVKAARPFTIHGDSYYEMLVTRVDEAAESGFTLRVSSHAVAAEPKAGQKLEVTFLMGQVTAAKVLG